LVVSTSFITEETVTIGRGSRFERSGRQRHRAASQRAADLWRGDETGKTVLGKRDGRRDDRGPK
jgi:hypothetical protein